MKNIVKCVGALALSLALIGCNTIEGLGKDIGTAGKSIEETAKDNK